MRRLILSLMVAGLGCLIMSCNGSPSEQAPPAAQAPDMNMSNSAL